MHGVQQIGEIIHDELAYQNEELLPDFEGNVDNLNKHIEKTSSAMDKLIEKSSNCCLIMIIIAEIVILLFVLFIL